MAGATTTKLGKPTTTSRALSLQQGTTESRGVRWLLTALALGFLTLFILLPAANVFVQAFAKGPWAYVQTLYPGELHIPDTSTITEKIQLKRDYRHLTASAEKNRHAIYTTLIVASIVIPLNVLFGLAAAWAITKFRFKGRTFLITLIDLPFSVSPVVAGLIFVLLFGTQGVWSSAANFSWPDPTSIRWRGFGPDAVGISHWFPVEFLDYYKGIIFTPIAIVLASIFVTFPFVARTLIPLMEAQGCDEELAAISLGASGWQTFRRVTMPNIKWGLLYGVILCTARALGEFGAVSVVSGHLDSIDTMPLRIEKLWQEYNNQAAFTIASLLTLLAMITLAIKTYIEHKASSEQKDSTTTPAK